MTLAELLSAQVVAGVVLAAAGMLVVLSIQSEQRVADKVNDASQGRTVAAQLEQRVNSQICLYPGEYMINGATDGTAASSIVYAGDNQLVYFADISGRGPTSNVGFQPYLRYLTAPTAGSGRNEGFIDAYRPPVLPTGATYATIPFNFNLAGRSLTDMAAAGAPSSVPPTSFLRRMGQGITNAVTGTTSTVVPYFQYWTSDNYGPTSPAITTVSGAVPSSQIDSIARIRVTFKVLGQSGQDKARTNSSRVLDDRTETFTTDIYMRTAPNICDQLAD